MIRIIALIILLSGFQVTNRYTEADSVAIGDSYNTMLEKMNDIPDRVKCYDSERYKRCTAMYSIAAYEYVAFTFNGNDILVSIYK